MNYGRRIVSGALTQKLEGMMKPAVIELSSTVQCGRCNTIHKKSQVQLKTGDYYCPSCILMGRLTTQESFFIESCLPTVSKENILFTWDGKLSPAQEAISEIICQKISENAVFLLQAVTGAGKTEILLKGICVALQSGKTVCIASPRIDVCRELHPRIQAVFPTLTVELLYGGVKNSGASPIIICTTHQLLKFYKVFDVLIIDEADAFPFEADERLAFSVNQARKEQSALVYVTATPSDALMAQLKQTAVVSYLPARYHRRPLPEPQLVWLNNWQKRSLSGKGLNRLLALLTKRMKQEKILLFCPSVQIMKQLFEVLRKRLSGVSMEAVHSQDPKRIDKVEGMRQSSYQIFLCTTMLERGVTFDNVSVFVYGANHTVFTKAALVQIAGRVDRKGPRANGRVYFFYDEKTKAIVAAYNEIKNMNRMARKRGLLDEMQLL